MRNSRRPRPGEVSRREFIASVAASPLLPRLAASQGDVVRNPSGQPLTWIEEQPLVIVGNWDDIPLFRRRVGGSPVGQPEEYRQEHTEGTVTKLRDLGVTMAILHFYKGFGLVAEREYIEDAVKLATLCHDHGIKVGVYVGSTVIYETFLLERPEAQEWFVPDFLKSR